MQSVEFSCMVFGAKMGMAIMCGKQYIDIGIDIEAVRC